MTFNEKLCIALELFRQLQEEEQITYLENLRRLAVGQ